NVFRIEVPPLAERPGDVMPLFRHFLSDLCVDDPLPRFTREARDALEAYRWSGNVREVRNLAIRLATFHAGETVDVKDLPGIEPPPRPVPEDLASSERQMIVEHMRRAGGNKSEAARTLGISREGLRLKLKRYDIRPEEWQDDEDD
ncbi:MAG: helix-turn-helix domain-containing protein, partial [Acidobacteriota bacterium]